MVEKNLTLTNLVGEFLATTCGHSQRTDKESSFYFIFLVKFYFTNNTHEQYF